MKAPQPTKIEPIILIKNKIALWDVIKSIERQGSLDSVIKNSVINDFESFYSRPPYIRYVFFNGKKAETEYKKWELYTKVPFLGVDEKSVYKN